MMSTMTPIKAFLLFCLGYAGIWAAAFIGINYDILGERNVWQILTTVFLISWIFFLPPAAFSFTFYIQTRLKRFLYMAGIAIAGSFVVTATYAYDFLDGGIQEYGELVYLLFVLPSAGALILIAILTGCLSSLQAQITRRLGLATVISLVALLISLPLSDVKWIGSIPVYIFLFASIGLGTLGFVTSMIFGLRSPDQIEEKQEQKNPLQT